MKNPFVPRIEFAFALAAVFLAGVARPAHAGWFGKDDPLPSWALDAAKTPTPAYADHSSAVILFDEYVETIDAQGRAVEREREAIRILKPQGRHHDCSVSYDVDEKINSFREWTVTADGKTFQAKDTDFVDVGGGEEGIVPGIPVLLVTERTRIVHPPAEDVGATIYCESEEQIAPWNREKVWSIQSTIPIAHQALELDLPPGGHYADSWHQHPPVQPVEVAPDHWRWEIDNMHGLDLRDIHVHPAWRALAARMSIYWGADASTDKDAEWRALGQWTADLEAHRPDPTPEITAEAQKLVAGAPDFYAKLVAITEYIQNNIRYFVIERGIGGFQAHPAGEIYRNRYGDCKDKTTLLISMLQAVGIEAFYMPVDDRRGVVDANAPSLAGNHMITAIRLPADERDPRLMAVVAAKDGTRYLIFDPTDERTPVGNLPSYLQGGYGLLAAGPLSQVVALPVLDPAANGADESGTFALAADGTLTGQVDALYFGPEGGNFRSFLKFTDDKERREAWESFVAEDLPGVTLDSLRFVQPDALSKPLEFHFSLTEPRYAHNAGTLLLARTHVLGSAARLPEDKPRKVPINLGATGRWRERYDIALPPGYVVDETPDPVDLDTDFASYHAATTAKGNTLHYERVYTVRKVELPASRAEDFRKFESAVLDDEKGMAVLRKQ